MTATATDAPDDEAPEFLGRVASLALGGTGAADPAPWVQQNLSSGGRLDAGGAELSLYGTSAVRTVVIVGTRVPVTEPRIEVPQPKIEQEITDAILGKADGNNDAPGKAKTSP